MNRMWFPLLLAIVAVFVAAPAASAATLTVDDDRAQCPGAAYTKVQSAIDAAYNGDTVAICPGTYVEGIGGTGTNALTISNKSINIRGAGADLVAIQPKRSTPTGGRIADTALNIRNGVGDIVSVIGTKALPVTVNMSGVTIDGNGVYVEAGVVYRDGGGTVSRSRVTNIVTSEANTADTLDGGYRSNFPGVGIAQVTSGGGTPSTTRPPLNIVQSRISRYNRYGVLIDSATGDTPPLTASTVTNQATLTGDQIVGRTQCTAFNTPTPPPYVLGGPDATPATQLPGNCSAVGLTTVGTTFGQDGVRVTAGSTATITDNTISANLVHGTAAPAYGSATNNSNLSQGAGVRLIGAGASVIRRSNLTDNAYGVYNVGLDGTTSNTTVPVSAENNYWGLRVNATANSGPAVSPLTNPFYQENPVNGTATSDATCVSSSGAAVSNSDAVDFCPFRNGNQADPNLGEYPVAYAPLPVADGAPTVTLAADRATYNRGDTVTLTANAADDFAIAKVAFYDGTTLVGEAVPPANTASFTIPSDAACAPRTLTAVAEDSGGQTVSDTETITVVGPNNCADASPTPPSGTGSGTAGSPDTTGSPAPTSPGSLSEPAAPTVALTGVPATIPEAGTTVGATTTVDPSLSVSEVRFRIGTRTACTDTQAPYSCDLRPTGAEVGAQSVQAVVVDSANRSATATANTTVAKFATKALSVKVKRGRAKSRMVRTISGKVTFNSRVTKPQACATGTATLTVYKNGSTLFPLTQVPLKANCTYALKFTVPKTRKHSFKVVASFGGNSVLLPARKTRRFS